MTTFPRLSPRWLLLATSLLVGCLTADGVVKPDGSGTLEMTYPLPAGAREAKEKTRHSSSNVTVESLVFNSDKKTATIKLTLDDVTKLSTAEAFNNVAVTRTKDGTDERLKIVITNPKPLVLKDDGQAGPKFTITFPGAVKEANSGGKVTDNKVVWAFGMPAFAKEKSIELSARYSAAAPAKDAAAPVKDAPAAAKDAPAAKK